MIEMYRSVFRLPSIRSRDVHVVYPIAVQTITPDARFLCRYRMRAGDERSPRSIQTLIRHENTARRTGNRRIR